MILRSLFLQNFRNYGEACVEFGPSFNLICGPNAKGKTTLLEAIHYFMLGRSFRTSQTADLIHYGKEAFFLHTSFAKHGIDQQIRISFEQQERKIIYNSTTLQNVSSLLGIIQGVVITPDDVNLIKGSPLLRRQYLDIQLAQLDPLYVHHLTRYTRAMRHRNHLLRLKQASTMDGWEHEMAQSAAYLVFQRLRAVQDLQTSCQKYYSTLSGEEEILSLAYKCSVTESKSLEDLRKNHLAYFRKHREREMRIGYTSGGPHKDDLFIAIGGKEVRHFASVGQQHSCVAAMHLAEWQRLKEMSGETPLLMVDDVGISLDEKRKTKLLSLLAEAGQVFLTTTDEKLLDKVDAHKKIIPVPF
jgi:DNA replication and repair protein RecF